MGNNYWGLKSSIQVKVNNGGKEKDQINKLNLIYKSGNKLMPFIILNVCTKISDI